jgi:RNA polymerase sigma-70 factor (ECF subfamily)
MTDHFRSSGREFPTDEIPDLPGNENIERDLDTAGAIKKIGQALEKLDEDLRQIIILRLWEELSFSEIGKVVGKSEGAVKMSFYRSIADLRNILVVFLIILAGQALADIGQVMIHIWKIK